MAALVPPTGDQHRRWSTDERQETAAEASKVRAELAKGKKQRETVYAHRLDGTIDKAMFTRIDAPLSEKEGRLTGELQRL
jgi:hypothetical protein